VDPPIRHDQGQAAADRLIFAVSEHGLSTPVPASNPAAIVKTYDGIGGIGREVGKIVGLMPQLALEVLFPCNVPQDADYPRNPALAAFQDLCRKKALQLPSIFRFHRYFTAIHVLGFGQFVQDSLNLAPEDKFGRGMTDGIVTAIAEQFFHSGAVTGDNSAGIGQQNRNIGKLFHQTVENLAFPQGRGRRFGVAGTAGDGAQSFRDIVPASRIIAVARQVHRVLYSGERGKKVGRLEKSQKCIVIISPNRLL
jgi:hypothetical protein